MGTKRKANEEILEIRSDDEEDGNDSDVQIQEKTIPVVTVDDDDETLKQTSEPANNLSCTLTATDRPVESALSRLSVSNLMVSQPTEIKTSLSSEVIDGVHLSPPPKTMTTTDDALLSMQFRDKELWQLFKGSLTEYLKTTFQLKLSGLEVDVIHDPETASLRVCNKQQSEPLTPKRQKTNAVDSTDSTGEKTDSIFVFDSTPAKNAKGGPIIPSYKKALQKVLDNSPSAAQDSATKKPKPKQNCWNCEGDHSLRDCKEPRNFARINKMKQEYMKRTDRYHVDLEQKYGHIVPGRMSSQLRQALGLKKNELPMHIYKMRIFGYPPGWLEDAKITHSGLQLFDSNGDPVLDSDESEGEVDVVKMKYDVRRIINYPGFNVPAGKQFHDDSKYFGVPPLLEHQSRERMIQNLEGTLVRGYRRKKMRMTATERGANAESFDMDLDNAEQNMDASFTTLDSVGQCDKMGENYTLSFESSLPSMNKQPIQKAVEDPEEGEVNDDDDVVSSFKTPEKDVQNVSETPVVAKEAESGADDSVILMEEETDIICLDDTRPESPSLDELRRKQSELLKQLEYQSPTVQSTADLTHDDSLIDDVLMAERLAQEEEEEKGEKQSPLPPSVPTISEQVTVAPSMFVPAFIPQVPFVYPVLVPPPLPGNPPPPPSPKQTASERPPEPEFLNLDEIKMSKIPFIDDPGSTGLKKMSLGTPILTAFSPFDRLPCGDAFSKGVSDVINFENLPNSTGKYERMKSLLTKVRTVITAHNGEAEQESR
ncbi:zinc finger CCHC domain-containing protein 8 homolog [Wyeomyia smithii]|uniref:zinc finger CCHC domain-containing protein 8 homolog n=1 Tax=Wyeomyia smithii TaxID=174621 RepID=UPI002467D558|nr:zinc finger CCHC domain-containing protein 8 homolog [Wyeomyia smithii]